MNRTQYLLKQLVPATIMAVISTAIVGMILQEFVWTAPVTAFIVWMGLSYIETQ